MITRLAAYYDEDNLYFVNVTTGGFGLNIPMKIWVREIFYWVT